MVSKAIPIFILILSILTVPISFSAENQIEVERKIIRETIPENPDYGSAVTIADSIAQDKAFEEDLVANGGPIVGYGGVDGIFIIEIYYLDADKLTDSDFEKMEQIVQTYSENAGKGEIPIRFISGDIGHFFPPRYVYTPLLAFIALVLFGILFILSAGRKR